MRFIRRVVLDTSTLVSAALRIESVPYQALVKALSSCELYASRETLAELEKVFQRRKFDKYLDRDSRRSFVVFVRRHAHLFPGEDIDSVAIDPPCRASRDNQFLALLLAAKADVLVSSDEDLLVLDPWRGIAIVTPAAFLTL